MVQIKGKWALVTGASRGIGKEIARALSGLGCNLVLHSTSIEHTHALAEEISANGISAISLQADLSDASQLSRLIADTINAAPQIDILYNNAAIMMPYCQDVWNISEQAYRDSFEINVISQIRLCNALIPSMLARSWGRVINLTSGINRQPQLAPYAISKAALKKYVEDCAPLLEGSGVSMNSLDPGWLRTDLGGQLAPNAVDSVIPGALVPALLSNAVSGIEYQAQDYTGMSIRQALDKAEHRT